MTWQGFRLLVENLKLLMAPEKPKICQTFNKNNLGIMHVQKITIETELSRWPVYLRLGMLLPCGLQQGTLARQDVRGRKELSRGDFFVAGGLKSLSISMCAPISDNKPRSLRMVTSLGPVDFQFTSCRLCKHSARKGCEPAVMEGGVPAASASQSQTAGKSLQDNQCPQGPQSIQISQHTEIWAACFSN